MRSIAEMTDERVAAWENAPMREVIDDFENGDTEAHLRWLHDPHHDAEKWIPMYEAICAVIERRYREGK